MYIYMYTYNILYIQHKVSFRKLSKGGNWRNLDFMGGMMVKDVTKFHKCHLGGRGMLECLCVHVCVQGFIYDIVFWEGRISKVRC